MQSEPFDSADLDAMLEFDRSRGWGLVQIRIREELERKRAALENGGDPERVRGEIASLRVVLTIPGILREEIKAVI
jgi:hypothetical protein